MLTCVRQLFLWGCVCQRVCDDRCQLMAIRAVAQKWSIVWTMRLAGRKDQSSEVVMPTAFAFRKNMFCRRKNIGELWPITKNL